MKTIYKYELEVEDKQEIRMPKGAKILSVQTQHGNPCIWTLVDNSEYHEIRTFIMHGTDHPCEESDLIFIGTIQMIDGNLVFHIFEQKEI